MPPSKPTPVAIGDVVDGKYRIERELGQGGVGIVVQARHLDLHQTVAIKILMLRNDEQVARFMHEARAAVRLRGEHVARAIDVGRLADGTPYMVMEFLEGEDLGTIADRHPLEVEDAATYLLHACEGVAEAHSLGIVHRDLKPSNLFLTRTSRGRPLVKVLDFGIAKRGDASGDDDPRLTGALAVIGSPPYMSPEQVRASRDVDVRSDVWSLGVSLYELLTGRLPFDGETVQDICARVLTETPTPVEQWQPSVPEGVRAVILRCLAKRPDDRFQNVAELASAIEPFAPVQARTAERVREALSTPPASGWSPIVTPVPAPPGLGPRPASTAETQTAFGAIAPRSPRRTRFAIGAAAAAALGVAVIGAVAVHFSSAPPHPAEPATPAAATTVPTDDTAVATIAPAPPPSSAPPVASASARPAASAVPSFTVVPRPAIHRPPAPRPTKPNLHPESSQM